jgi:DNA-binding CsgD family transcriptional regulator
MDENSKMLAERLDTLIALVAYGLVQGKKQREQIRILCLAGLKPSRIAELLGTTPNTVNVALTSLRREGAVPKAQKG